MRWVYSGSVVFINRCFIVQLANYKVKVAVVIKISISCAITDSFFSKPALAANVTKGKIAVVFE
jgi:hypothetical protein